VAANRRAEVDQALADVDFSKNTYQVEFDTTMGKILLDVYPEVAPGHAKNLIGLTKIGFYDGIIFHRVISGFVVQVGCPDGNGTGGPGYKIPAEFNKTQHDAGILSMARTSDPNSAGSQFFICLSRRGTASLDNQYTVFGKTADQASLDVVLKIGNVETNPDDRPLKEVKINKGRVHVKGK
jgi:cyclophilin family peptidyl-prolyl cis-trans isomerase